MEIGDTRLSGAIRICGTLLGNGLNPSSSILYYIYSIIFHGCFTFTFVLCLCLNILFITDVNETTHALYMSLTCLAYAVKVANYYFYHREIYQSLHDIKHFNLRSNEEKLIHDRRNGVLSWIAVFYYTIPTLCGATAYYKPFMDDIVIELPFRAWYPFDWRHVGQYYWIAWGYQVFGMVLIIFNNVTMDLTPSYTFNILAIQTEVLGLRLSNMGNGLSTNDDLKSNVFVQNQIYKDLCDCIKLHQNILSLTKLVEKYYTIALFAQICLSSTVICTLAYQLTYTSPRYDFVDFFYYFSFMISVQMQIYLLCHYGDEVILTHNSLTYAAYNSTWYAMSTKNRKLLITFMERVKMTNQILVGKLFPLNLRTLTAILNFSYRLYAVISNTH